MKKLIVAALVMAVALLAFAGQSGVKALHDPEVNQTEVNNAIDDGVAYLLSTQQANGCWSSIGVTTGVTALAMLGIINSEPGGYAALGAAEKTAVDDGTTCLLGRVQVDGTIKDGAFDFLSTYNTSIAIWALSEVPDTGPEGAAIAGGRGWLLANQRNDGGGRCDAGGHINNGGWYYNGGTLALFVEHSNSSFAVQALAVTGGMPAATADLAEGFFTCLQNRAPNFGLAVGIDGGFVYSNQGTKGGSRTSHTGSGSFALSLSGVAAGDGRIVDSLAFLDEALSQNPCNNMLHNDTGALDAAHWFAQGDLVHYAQWATLKAYELAGVADDVNDSSNWFYKLANCIIHEQNADGSCPATSREDQILATSFCMLTLERVTPPPPHGIGTIKPGTPFTPDPSGNGRAVAFDGLTTLYYTRFPDVNIYMVTTGGVSLGPIPNPGRAQCGSLSWDSGLGELWCGSYDGTGDVYTVHPGTGVATLQFTHAFAPDSCYGGFASPFIDGLAFDSSDSTIWLSGDAARTIYHVTSLGAVLGSFTAPDHPNTGATGCSTGIEVAPGGFLELAMQTGPDQGPHVIAKIEKADDVNNPPIIVSFTALNTNNPGIEDIAYDAKTFEPRCALWTNQFGADVVLTAFDVQCTRTIGYWKNHSDDAVEFLPITLGDDDTDGVCQTLADADDVEDILKAAKAKDAAVMLYAQLLAAKLNVAMGDIPEADLAAIGPVIKDADDLLGRNGCDPDTGKRGADRAEATALKSALDAFNNKYSP